jgi:hypothetical protein
LSTKQLCRLSSLRLCKLYGRGTHGLTAAELQAEFDALTPQGFRPIDASAHTIADQPRFAAIRDKSPIQAGHPVLRLDREHVDADDGAHSRRRPDGLRQRVEHEHRWHDGDLPRSASIGVRTRHQYYRAVLVNSRQDAQLDAMRADLDGLMWAVVDHIKDWPSFDLF